VAVIVPRTDDRGSGPAQALAGGRVLIGFADALAAPETAWSLAGAGFSVVAFARRGSRPALRRSRGLEIIEITSPSDDVDASLAELCALVGREQFVAVMPLDDSALWLCDAAARRDPGFRVAGPIGSAAELALDKRLQLQAASRAGFSVPATRCVEAAHELSGEVELPVVLKPAHPVRRVGPRLVRGRNYVCGTRQELAAAARRWDGSEPLLVQPLLVGQGEGLFGLAATDRLLAPSAHRRLRMMNPQGSGSSACISTHVDGSMAEAAERMLIDVGWMGLFMLEFLRTADGTSWFMELNGRPWGSMALARRTGLEYPAWALRQFNDEDFRPTCGPPKEGEVCRHLGREIVHLLMVLRGPRSTASKGWPSRGRAVRDVLTFRRREHWYNCRRGELSLFLDDTVTTVIDAVRG
jgi:predicted ATP-grasp superfamily ATP-dependent carboligase